MWMSAEDARSDFILAAAGMALGTELLRFVLRVLNAVSGGSLPPGGVVGTMLLAVWILVLTVLVARFFVTYRGQGLAGYGLRDDTEGLAAGMLLAAPLLLAGYVRGIQADLGPVSALLGRVHLFARGGDGALSPLEATAGVAVVAVAALGATMMYGLLTTRARDAFRSVDMPVVEALRTFGLGAVAVSTVLGLLVAAGDPTLPATSPLFDGVALAVVVLLADRMVDAGDRTTRATMLAPAIAGIVVTVMFVGGGLFGSDLATALWRGTAAAAIVVTVAALLETRRAAWAAVPLVAAAMWAPTCTTLPIAPGYGLGSCL